MNSTPTGPKVLYAEDDERLQQLTLRILEQKLPGCSITAVNDGDSCLLAFKLTGGVGFDLILTDKDMPIMSGIEVISELAKMSQAGISVPPIILYTGDSDGAHIPEDFYESLRISILAKSCRGDDLAEAIRTAIKLAK